MFSIRLSIISCVLLLCASSATANTIGPGCKFAWDYPVASESRIDGYRLYLDGQPSSTALASARELACPTMTDGSHIVALVAYNAAGESAKSNALDLVFVSSKPDAPTVFRMILSFGGQ